MVFLLLLFPRSLSRSSYGNEERRNDQEVVKKGKEKEGVEDNGGKGDVTSNLSSIAKDAERSSGANRRGRRKRRAREGRTAIFERKKKSEGHSNLVPGVSNIFEATQPYLSPSFPFSVGFFLPCPFPRTCDPFAHSFHTRFHTPTCL